MRMRCLALVKEQGLPDWFIAAGFVRNAIWDAMHGYTKPTPLNDVDVIYFDASATPRQESAIQHALSRIMPEVNWQVKNQARMHNKHGHAPYKNSAEAIARWVEVPTCVGVTLTGDGSLQVIAPYGLSCCFSLRVCINPAYPNETAYLERVNGKQWQRKWPKLDIALPGRPGSDVGCN